MYEGRSSSEANKMHNDDSIGKCYGCGETITWRQSWMKDEDGNYWHIDCFCDEDGE